MRLFKITDDRTNETMFATTDHEEFNKKCYSLVDREAGVISAKPGDVREQLLDLDYELTIDEV